MAGVGGCPSNPANTLVPWGRVRLPRNGYARTASDLATNHFPRSRLAKRFTRIRLYYDLVTSGAGKRQAAVRPADEGAGHPGWTFLTNHAHVLLCVAGGESLTARELALQVGITERSVQAILADLTDEGYLIKSKVGRRNAYTINTRGKLRHPLEITHTVGELIAALS